uniref:Uncharacterized protein n=1 Tax=Variovorax paradoxus (strain S110) TaxID=543728 RepID=C5CUX7_VARPS
MKTTETLNASNELEIRFANGAVVRQTHILKQDRQSGAGYYFGAAVDAVNAHMEAAAAIVKDDNLSAAGRVRKLEPLVIAAVRTVSACAAEVELVAAALDARYAALVAVPELAAGNFADTMKDFEIRQWWRSLSISERGDTLRAIQAGPEFQRIELALLRSPVLIADHELQIVRSAWDKAKCDDSPGESIDITAGRAVVEWGRRGLAQVAGVLVASLGADVWPARRILEVVLAGNERQSAGYRVFGFTPLFAAVVTRQQAQRAATASV